MSLKRRKGTVLSTKIELCMLLSLLMFVVAVSWCHASPASSYSSFPSRTRRSASTRNLSSSEEVADLTSKKRKRRKKRVTAEKSDLLVDEELLSDFLPLDFGENEDEERIVLALDRLEREFENEKTTFAYTPTRKEQTKQQPIKPAVERPVSSLLPAVGVTRQETMTTLEQVSKEKQEHLQQQQQHHQWRAEIPSTIQGVQRSTLTAAPSYHGPPQTFLANTQSQQAYQDNTPFQRTARPATIPQNQQADASNTVSLFPPTTPWILKFLSSRPKDSLLPIPREYLSDGFNLVHLPLIVEHVGLGTKQIPATTTFPLYKAALHLILQEHDETTALVPAAVQRAAECLYTLVHARYVISPRGLETVHRVLREKPIFGRCPRTGCHGMPVLPYSERSDYDMTHSCMTKSYCCNCGETFTNWDSKVDGAAWGPSFCHLLLMTYGKDLMQQLYRLQIPPSSMEENLVAPSIFGFKVHAASMLARQPDVV